MLIKKNANLIFYILNLIILFSMIKFDKLYNIFIYKLAQSDFFMELL